MLVGFGFVDINAEAGRGGRQGVAVFDGDLAVDDVLAPRYVFANDFLDEVVGRGEGDVGAGGSGDGSLRIVSGDGDGINLGRGGDLAVFADAAAV